MKFTEAQVRRWLPWVGACFGAASVIVFTATYGIGTSPDGVYYISVARNLLAGQGFIGFDDTLFVHWPPFYPMLLALPGLMGIDPQEGVRYLHALLIGGTVYVALYTLKQHIQSIQWLVFLTIALVVSKPIMYVGIRAMSEPLFGLIVLGFVLGFIAFSEKPSWGLLSFVAVCAALAFVTRYMGFVCVIMGVGVLVTRSSGWAERFRYILVFSTIACLPIGGWLLRNLHHTGTLTGARYASAYGIGANAEMVLEAIGLFFFPDEVPLIIRSGAVVLLLIALSIGAYGVYQRERTKTSQMGRLIWGMRVFCVTYVVLLVIVRSLFASDILNMRLLYPIYVPLVILIGIVVDRYRRRLHVYPWLYRLIIFAFCLWLIYSVAYTIRIGYFSFTRGSAGFAYQEWVKSELMDAVGHLSDDSVLLSNYAGAVHWHTRLPAHKSVQLYKGQPQRNTERLQTLVSSVAVANRPMYLAWFEQPMYEERYIIYFASPGQLAKHVTVREVERVADGVLYELLPSNTAPVHQ